MINIKELKPEHTFTLHKINMEILGEIPNDTCTNMTRGIGVIDEIKFTIRKYIYDRLTLNKVINHIFDEIKEERLICVNDNECFVIKDIEDSDGVSKEITARSREVKLNRIDINIEDLGLQLYTSDLDSNILSLNDYMKEQTGWSLGNVDDDIVYDVLHDGSKVEKIRWEESINSNWYDFLTQDIKEQFGCVVTFDSYNKKVNLLNYDSFGDNIQLYLSYDNYVKTLKKNTSTQDIVTRLNIVGNEEMDITGATCTGYPYLENYSYFLDNEEMSVALMSHIFKYQSMLKIREPQWQQLVDEKLIKDRELRVNKDNMTTLYAEINAKERIKETYKVNKDDINYARLVAELTILYDEKSKLELMVGDLEKEVIRIQNSINDLNVLCKRETATDENGNLIFTTDTLEELKEFIYNDTYTNDSFIDVQELVKSGQRELSMVCTPTFSWNIDSVNFVGNLLDRGFRSHWKGTLALGDIIILYDEEKSKEELLYLVAYSQDFQNSKLQLELSNKKIKEDKQRIITDYINKADKAMRQLNMKSYLFIQQKYKRINLPKELIERGNI